MENDPIRRLRQEIADHESNRTHSELGYAPLFAASPDAKIVIVGQAPGIRAQMSGMPWNDASGDKLMLWLGVTDEQFRDESIFAHIPMDFYYPGKGVSGDLPPRKDFAPLWHKRLLDLMPRVELVILVGHYAQKYYLPASGKRTLTDTVRDYKSYLPRYFPIVHPSPLNFRWRAKNPWFEEDVVPLLRKEVARIIAHSCK